MDKGGAISYQYAENTSWNRNAPSCFSYALEAEFRIGNSGVSIDSIIDAFKLDLESVAQKANVVIGTGNTTNQISQNIKGIEGSRKFIDNSRPKLP